MQGRTIAIGDIHGCATALRVLLDAIAPTANDVVIPLGDYIDRGPDSPQVLEMLIELAAECQLHPLRGNHEAMMLLALEQPSELSFWLSCGGRETLDAYRGEIGQIPNRHIDFVRQCQLYFETDTHFFVHANYTPTLPLSRQPEYVLLWEHLTTHLPDRHQSGKQAIVGHTPQTNGRILAMEHLVCIDTNCFGGGWLTALDVDRRQVWQVNRQGLLRDD